MFRPAATAPETVETELTRATSTTARVSTSTRTTKRRAPTCMSTPATRFSKAYGGTAKSNGDQSSDSGHDTSKVYADTTAYQTNFLAADMSQHVAAGIGGNGGNDNYAKGGEIDFKSSMESANLNNVLNDSEHFHVDDIVHV